MFKTLRIFSEPEHPVLSLAVQASLYTEEQPQRTQFQVLLRHFLSRFFLRGSGDGQHHSEDQSKARVLQIAYAIALPGLCFAIYLFPPYHYPGGRPFWSQAADHYFYVMYSFVAVGAVTIFVWDLFLPDLLDVFVLSTLSIERRTLFAARTAAVGLFLAIFLLGANALGTIFFPAAADLPSLAHHLGAHFAAVTMSGLCVAGFVLATQASLLVLLGENHFRRISPFLQALAIAALLTTLLMFPLISRFLEALLTSGQRAVFYFPPFWFLGIYERLLDGGETLPVFAALGRAGLLATGAMVLLACAAYPLAYRAKLRNVVEGSGAAGTRSWLAAPMRTALHGTLLRVPQQRGVFHFIGQTLTRTPRHRVYLAMYGGLGLALVVACALVIHPGRGGARLALSPEGLRAAVPIVAFWTVAGLRAAFLGPADRRVNWIFRIIHGKPGWDESAATQIWVLLWALALTLASVALACAVAPPELRGRGRLGIQIFAAVSLCLLLTDAFFLNVKTIPFTAARAPGSMNLAYVLIQYFGLFPPLVLIALGLEDWIAVGVGHLLIATVAVAAGHLELRRRRKIVLDSLRLLDVDEDEEEFPQRLGLRY
jgi:hypothetical protein